MQTSQTSDGKLARTFSFRENPDKLASQTTALQFASFTAACRLLSPLSKCSQLSLFADASSLSRPSALQSSYKLGAVPTEMVQGKSQIPASGRSSRPGPDLGRVRSIVVEHAVLETLFNSSHSAAVDVFGVQEHGSDVRPPFARVPAVTARKAGPLRGRLCKLQYARARATTTTSRTR